MPKLIIPSTWINARLEYLLFLRDEYGLVQRVIDSTAKTEEERRERTLLADARRQWLDNRIAEMQAAPPADVCPAHGDALDEWGMCDRCCREEILRRLEEQ